MAPSVWEQGAVACGRCGTAFEDVAERRVEAEAGEAVVDDRFLARRRAALEEEAAPRGGVHAESAAVLEAERARLTAALGLAPEGGSAHLRPLLERLEHIERLLRATDHLPGALPPALAVSETQRDGIRELVEAEADAGDLAEVSRWYEAFGTPAEAPMPPERAGGRERTGLARALLKADGTLRGPAFSVGDSEVATGDRVIASRDVPGLGLPAGTPGVVEQVERSGGVHIDFATWGRLEMSVATMLDAGITHGYVDHDASRNAPSRVATDSP